VEIATTKTTLANSPGVSGKVKIPEWDSLEFRPKTKMPNCPNCDEDELGMLSQWYTLCYNCGLEITADRDGYLTIRHITPKKISCGLEIDTDYDRHPTHQNVITRPYQ